MHQGRTTGSDSVAHPGVTPAPTPSRGRGEWPGLAFCRSGFKVKDGLEGSGRRREDPKGRDSPSSPTYRSSGQGRVDAPVLACLNLPNKRLGLRPTQTQESVPNLRLFSSGRSMTRRGGPSKWYLGSLPTPCRRRPRWFGKDPGDTEGAVEGAVSGTCVDKVPTRDPSGSGPPVEGRGRLDPSTLLQTRGRRGVGVGFIVTQDLPAQRPVP